MLLRTLSKLGLAGIRLGFLVGPEAWLHEIDKTRPPYNINVMTQITAKFALQHADIFAEQTKEICQQRELLSAGLHQFDSLTVYPSKANFILFKVASGQAATVFEHLKSNGVLIKNLHGSAPALEDCLRVTVGTEQQNKQFLSALKTAIV